MKKKVILALAYLFSMMPMLFHPYASVVEAKQLPNINPIYQPIAGIAILVFFLGVFVTFKNKKITSVLRYGGVIGIILAQLMSYQQLHHYLFMHQTHNINTHLVFIEVYLWMMISIMMLIFLWIVENRLHDDKKSV